jgi:hypothetical protein
MDAASGCGALWHTNVFWRQAALVNCVEAVAERLVLEDYCYTILIKANLPILWAQADNPTKC